ncbi:hypothetical protein Purlil1_13117 [Purpureocillium lilacinum]|uniref:Uncharacterized protein n=1 Tax=Purpureocillium lilacinum TaxID=33203 RepID=A0ABR0BEY4_PURLI|nr:hypothetical protein Purlil1_13117 [Purpureocillium lilacinum]
MSEYHRKIEELQHLLEKERREKEQERREKEQERREKEQERREKERERREKEEEQRKNRKTTLKEYLHNCHVHLYQKLVLADKSKSSTGLATRVDGRYYPKWLRPWNSFTNYQRQQHFEDIRRVCGERRLFNQESTTRDIGSTLSRNQAGNENAIDRFEKLAVEDPVWEVLAPVWEEGGQHRQYEIMGLRFSNNIRDFTQPSDGSQSRDIDVTKERHVRRQRTGTSKRAASVQGRKNPPLQPDGWGIRTSLDGEESLAFVYDYKAAHKFALEYLKAALRRERLFMEVIELINSDQYKKDTELRETEKQEARIAMALTQVFNYMVWYGVAYGYVAAGESLVFLHFDRAEPQTLYYHLCVPDEAVGEASAGDWGDQVSYTAVAQLASFCLLSVQSEALKGQSLDAALQKAKKELATWGEPYEDAARLLEAPGEKSPSASSSRGTDGSEFRSKAAPASRKYALRSRSSCMASTVLSRDSDEDEQDGPNDHPCHSGTKTDARKEGPSSGNSEDRDVETSGSAPTKQYCTQACLLSLKTGGDLDGNCPNVLSHCIAKGATRHPIDASEFTRLVGERLRQNPYEDCEALDGRGKAGAIGVLFKLELAPYGYTFVGKGTLSCYFDRLEHESRVYAQLNRLQGKVVPVHLGMVEMARGYVLPGGARVVDMMLMSWGGEEASDASVSDLTAEVRRSSQEVWAEGVYHGDERDHNLLWNNERRRVMLVDFDRATLRPMPKHKQVIKLSGKKRKQRVDDVGVHTGKRGPLKGRAQLVGT